MNPLLAVLLFLDRLVNALIGGSFAETLSARAHRSDAKNHPYWGWTASAINTLFFWDKDHCQQQWAYEQANPYQGWHPDERLLRLLAVLAVLVVLLTSF